MLEYLPSQRFTGGVREVGPFSLWLRYLPIPPLTQANDKPRQGIVSHSLSHRFHQSYTAKELHTSTHLPRPDTFQQPPSFKSHILPSPHTDPHTASSSPHPQPYAPRSSSQTSTTRSPPAPYPAPYPLLPDYCTQYPPIRRSCDHHRREFISIIIHNHRHRRIPIRYLLRVHTMIDGLI